VMVSMVCTSQLADAGYRENTRPRLQIPRV